LRIQAAAVAAQQAALTDEELRLHQRRLALEKQEAQLAAHLEDRRLRLVELHDEIKPARTAGDDARAALDRDRAALAEEVRRERDAAAKERERLAELHR